MRPGLLRVAAAVALVQGVAHGMMLLTATPHHGPSEAAVVAAMRNHAFVFGGRPLSYWRMYMGYGLLAAAICAFEAVLLWQAAVLASRREQGANLIAGAVIGWNVVHAAFVLGFFFLVPLYADLVVTALAILALVS